MRAAVIASDNKYLQAQENIEPYEKIIFELAKQKVRLACFPELSLTSYTTNPEILDIAQNIPGAWTKSLEDIANITMI